MNTRNTKRYNLNIHFDINHKIKESNKRQQQVINEEKLNVDESQTDMNNGTAVRSSSNNHWSEEKHTRDAKSVFYCKWKLCSFRTVSECLIRKHTIKHQKPYTCSFVSCGQRFAQTKDLLSHFSSTHLDTNAFKCNFANCSLAFSDLKSLTDHRVSHVSKNPKFSINSDENRPTDCEAPTKTQTEGQTNAKIIHEKKVITQERLNNQNIVSLKLSHCIDNNGLHSIDDSRANLVKDSSPQKSGNSQRLTTTTIELAESEPQIDTDFKHKNVKSDNFDKFRNKAVNSVIRCSNNSITDEIIEGNDNYVKLRSIDGRFWYKCLWDYCDYGNINEGIIRRHVQKHEFPHKCSFDSCNKNFATVSEMALHLKLTHYGEKPYKCDWLQCEDAFPSLQTLSQHKRQHLRQSISCESKVKKVKQVVEKKFQCSFGKCIMNFATNEELEVHQQIHSGVRPFKCLYPECTFAAKTKDKLKIHHSRHSRDKVLKCLWPTCDKSFTIGEQLRRHEKSHTNKDKLICEFDQCDLMFESARDLEKHLRKHLGLGERDLSNDLKCHFGFCKMHFQTKEELRSHSQIHNRGKRLYKCGYDNCSYSGKTLDKLSAHIRYHSGERPFRCDFIGCHQSFIQSHHLARHRKTHFGEKDFDKSDKSVDGPVDKTMDKPIDQPIIQSPCSKSYSSERSLEAYDDNKHTESETNLTETTKTKRKNSVEDGSDSGDLPSVKDLDFDSSETVAEAKAKKKMMINWSSNNKSFCCDFGKCSFRCVTNEQLNKHKAIHSGSRPFVCSYDDCTYRTSRKENLVIHTRRHTGEKPYKCEWNDCKQAFVTRDHLKRHTQSHSKSKQTLKQLQKLEQEIERSLKKLDQLLQ